MKDAAIHAQGLTRRVAGRALIEDAAMWLMPGEVLGIIGPNGAGKSTLVRLLAGLDRPDAGAVTLQARPLRDWPPRARALCLGYLPQHFTPHWDYRVTELLRLGLDRVAGGAAGLADLAVRHGVAGLLERRWSSLSGGERGRVLAAAVLAPSPPVILADEPSAALDIGQAAAMMALLRGRAAVGAAVGVVVHDINLAARWCDRLLVLAGGRIRAEGTPAAVLAPGLLDDVFGVAFERLRSADGCDVVLAGRSPRSV